jgi:hypothetical protein
MNAMFLDHQTCIMTDQDQAMMGVIDVVFLVLVHYCFMWHVLRIANDKLGTIFRTHGGFENEFFYCIYGLDIVLEEFENMWQAFFGR